MPPSLSRGIVTNPLELEQMVRTPGVKPAACRMPIDRERSSTFFQDRSIGREELESCRQADLG